jgi:hypothetical protein
MTAADRIIASYPPVSLTIRTPRREGLPPACPAHRPPPDPPYANAGR